jgi:hypothetical protein
MVQSYYDPNLFKTNASADIIYDVLKKYKMENYKDEYMRNVKENTYKYNILTKEIKVNPTFVDVSYQGPRITKYPEHPLPNWGPLAKAKLLVYKYKNILHFSGDTKKEKKKNKQKQHKEKNQNEIMKNENDKCHK